MSTLDTTPRPSTTPTTERSLFRTLIPADRCDRCGAQAYIQAVKGGSDLLFCGHHGRNHMPILVAQGWSVSDSTDKINQKAGASA